VSTYRPKNKAGAHTSPFYQYDFWLEGRRFHGSTGCRLKREADREEQKHRALAKALIDAAPAEGEKRPLSLDLAAERYWQERGKFFRGNARATFEASLAWLVSAAGPDTPIRAITNSTVSALVAQRRGETARRNGKARPGTAPPKLVTNSTVNRTVLEPLRMLLNRARDAWDEPVAKIAWGTHRLDEPKERTRELTSDEEVKLFAALPPDYQVVVDFALMTGCRLAECVGLLWSDIDWGGRQITIRGKGDKTVQIPLSAGVRELLFPLPGAAAVGADRSGPVFTYACRKKRGARQVGDRLPMTYEGLKTQWRRSRDASGVTNFRYHDNRHTAATRILRAGGNLKTVQVLLRHEDITTTAKYAHVNDHDVRSAMEAAESRKTRSATPSPEISPEIVSDTAQRRSAGPKK
jgi:integrase